MWTDVPISPEKVPSQAMTPNTFKPEKKYYHYEQPSTTDSMLKALTIILEIFGGAASAM